MERVLLKPLHIMVVIVLIYEYRGIFRIYDPYYIPGQPTSLPCLPQVNLLLSCLLRVHWGFGVAVMGGRPAENLCLQISV